MSGMKERSSQTGTTNLSTTNNLTTKLNKLLFDSVAKLAAESHRS